MSALDELRAALAAAADAAGRLAQPTDSDGAAILWAVRVLLRFQRPQSKSFFFDHFFDHDDYDRLAAALDVGGDPGDRVYDHGAIISFFVDRDGLTLGAQASKRASVEPPPAAEEAPTEAPEMPF